MKKNLRKIDISKKLKKLPSLYILILDNVYSLCSFYDFEVYLIGGLVRNIILDKKNNDLDFILYSHHKVNNLEQILQQLAKIFNSDYHFNRKFNTGNIKLKNKINIDFAMARKEYYPFPGSLPEVRPATIKNDLLRRDFTINTLLMDVSPGNRGMVYDYLGGLEDLNKKYIRVLHNRSFIDDPTRIIRGIRQAVELNFTIEENTYILMQKTLQDEDFLNLTPVRVVNELKQLFSLKFNNKFISLINKIPFLNLLIPDENINYNFDVKLMKLEELLAYFNEKNYNVKDWLLRLAVILSSTSSLDLTSWNLSKNEEEILIFSQNRINKYRKILKNSVEHSQIAEVLGQLSIEEHILLMLFEQTIAQKIKFYHEQISSIKLNIDGNDLIELGLKPGPFIKEILNKIWKAKLNGELNNYQEELTYAQKLIMNKERSSN